MSNELDDEPEVDPLSIDALHERGMQHLKDEDPDEYERVKKAEEDADAFIAQILLQEK